MLDKRVIAETLDAALSNGAHFSEIFVEQRSNQAIGLIGGLVENTVSGRDYGIGIRIIRGTESVYAYTNDTSLENLKTVAGKASLALLGKRSGILLDFRKYNGSPLLEILKYPGDIGKREKVRILKRAHEAAKGFSDEITQVRINYMDTVQKVLVANSEGMWAEDERVRTRTSIQTVAEYGGEMQTGHSAPGASMGFEFYDTIDLNAYATSASETAVKMLHADAAPSGKMPVVIDNGFGGVIFHEACGHGLEATSVAKGTSVFAGKIGEKIASDIVTAIDDGSIPGQWGSARLDDEGIETRKNVLIENGVLKGYMVDRLNGKKMGMDPTGSGRRQSYKYSPTSRMTNTYIAPGKSSFEDLIENTQNGLYAKKMGGGSVNPATGEFNFAVMEGYLIENGKIGKPVRGATLIGNGLSILTKIDMVADNLEFGQGMCGSISGSVPVNVGQPALRVESITVGGRKER
jgi:TldD protein